MSHACRLIVLLCAVLPAVSAAAADGLIAHWQFDSAESQILDLSGNGHTAALSGGQAVTEGEKTFLRLDGETKITVPSAPDLCLRRGLCIEARLRPTDISDGRLLVFKKGEYLLRVDWPVESSRLSFFTYLEDAWEPRVGTFKLPTDVWYHLVASWDGTQLRLWVNGLPHQVARRGEPTATEEPLCIGSGEGFGRGFVGDLEYVKLYSRPLTSAEVIAATYGAGGEPRSPGSAAEAFEFASAVEGWDGTQGARVQASAEGLVVHTESGTALAMHDNLNVDLGGLDYLSLRMSVDHGSRAALVYITDRGAGRMPFSTIADGAMHSYVLEPWQWPGWEGRLLGLGIAPSDATEATTLIRYVRLGAEPRSEGEVRVLNLTTESVLPRAERPERLTVRLSNVGGPATGLQATLRCPEGVTLPGDATQAVPELGYGQQAELGWEVRARVPGPAEFSVEVAGPQVSTARLTATVPFSPAVEVSPADYVPEPVPAQMGKYEVWTHYCPLWKHGTHYGWKRIEPYPERKPVLGWYNEGTPEVADWHIKWWLEHGISGVVYCWYRSSINGPVQQSLGHAIHDGLLKARYLDRIRFGIMWENGCGQGVGSVDDLMDNVLPFWLDNYFTHPSYLKVDGKPVLYIWVPGNVTKHLGGSDRVKQTFEAMREACRRRGLEGLYIVGCVGFGDRASLERMAQEGWDATSAYGNQWSPPADSRSVGGALCAAHEGFVDQQEAIWKAKAEIGALPDITAAMMGWDQRPWNENSFYWCDNTPEKFRELCRRAKALMDAKSADGPEKRTAIFCCWNEFGEGHYIEPTRGYGFSHLDAIRDTFSDSPTEHVDLAPEDVGLGPYDSWYREAREAAPMEEGPTSRSSWTGAELGSWSGMMGLGDVKVGEEGFRAVSVTDDPALSSPPLKLRASEFTKVVVEMRVSRAGGAQLFWSTASLPRAEERASAHVETRADGEFHSYSFDVGQSEYWGGCVTGMRLDPSNTEGVTIEVRAIRLE